MQKSLFTLPFLIAQLTYACPVGHTGLSPAALKELQKATPKKTARKVSSASSQIQLPTEQSEQPWGGKDSSKWKPEAILANATSFWLNKAWSEPNVAEVRVSVPVKMIFTHERVYRDGQTNASLKFGPNWKENHPQLIAALTKYKDGKRKVVFNFSKALNLTQMKVQLTRFQDQIRKDETLEIKNQKGLLLAEWTVPAEHQFGDFEKSRVIWLRPAGWKSSFPIDFRMDIRTEGELLTKAKGAKTAGLSPMDLLDVRARAEKSHQLAQTVLAQSTFGPEWLKNDKGSNELRNESIHGEIPGDNNQKVKTAVGGGLTWLVVAGANSTFKNLYTCFDARNFQNESGSGVPSGGGWHEIGDAAETIINDLETGPVPVGVATGLPWPTPPDNTEFPWELSDIATIRLLMPGEALLTAAGDQTWKEDHKFHQKDEKICPNKETFHDVGDDSERGSEKSGGGRNYHWFFFPSSDPTCTQEWVHNLRPQESSTLGLGCN